MADVRKWMCRLQNIPSNVPPKAPFRWNNPALNGECHEHCIWRNTVDAARCDIKDGDKVEMVALGRRKTNSNS